MHSNVTIRAIFLTKSAVYDTDPSRRFDRGTFFVSLFVIMLSRDSLTLGMGQYLSKLCLSLANVESQTAEMFVSLPNWMCFLYFNIHITHDHAQQKQNYSRSIVFTILHEP